MIVGCLTVIAVFFVFLILFPGIISAITGASPGWAIVTEFILIILLIATCYMGDYLHQRKKKRPKSLLKEVMFFVAAFLAWPFLAGLISVTTSVPEAISAITVLIFIVILFVTRATGLSDEKKRPSGKGITVQFSTPKGKNTSPHWVSQSDLMLPIAEKDGSFSDRMDRTEITILYSDRNGNITERTIELERLDYEQKGQTIYPRRITAYCHLRHDQRTFFPDNIMSAEIEGVYDISITDLDQFLIEHTNIRRQTAQEQHLTIMLDSPRVLLLCGYANPDRKPTSYVMQLSSMKVTVRNGTQIIDTVTGFCERIERDRNITFSRVISLCDPETGEVIEDPVSFLNARRVVLPK
ncbi:hypothetical protein PT277_01680 [Acetobacteraceae bacterium ESL0709]|nr:hypothetical protein [Acetobacteraceae bacterium ESL0697]MDF7677412.1 hypothetical protein [Acetobacteraceae bacterium ESL0709]